PYAEYGLGNVLHSLEDSTSALLRYDNSLKTIETSVGSEHRELRYRNFYNSGIIFFEDGDYHSAAISFRQALRLDPRRIDAKRNLELSLMSITMDAKIKNQGEGRQEQREILFDYLRQEEQQRWRSREWTPEDNFSGLDY
ncbi:MAG: tetratricopeptide repeat protein, partial [Treponema sp.]|nr:tetratricopeptide repeat protein [Treponema sp.]